MDAHVDEITRTSFLGIEWGTMLWITALLPVSPPRPARSHGLRDAAGNMIGHVEVLDA